AGQPLGAVRALRDGAAKGRALEQVARRGPGRPVQPIAAQSADQRSRLGRPASTLLRGRLLRTARGLLLEELERVHGEERRPQQRGLRYPVVSIGETSEPEEELAVQRIREQERAAPRGVGDVFRVE